MKINIDSTAEELGRIEEMVDQAVAAIGGDGGCSPALKAVVSQFQEKARAARSDAEDGETEEVLREHIVELEQAADSAKVAAEADSKIAAATKETILRAHQAIEDLKEATE